MYFCYDYWWVFNIYIFILFLDIVVAMAPKTPQAQTAPQARKNPQAQTTPQAQMARKTHGNTCAMCDSICVNVSLLRFPA